MSNLSHRSNSFGVEKSLLRRNYGMPKPVREYRRFMNDKVADTGEDAKGGMIELMKNDIIRPLERLKPNTEHLTVDSNKWALKSQKNCCSKELLPKIQQYKDYYFPNRNAEDVERFKNTYHKTDNVSIRVPDLTRKVEGDSFLSIKSTYTI